jgi:hypothetical protein
MTVDIEITETGGSDDPADGPAKLIAKCGRCNHEVSVYGHSERSRRRAAAMLREQCPEEENNYYRDSDAG